MSSMFFLGGNMLYDTMVLYYTYVVSKKSAESQTRLGVAHFGHHASFFAVFFAVFRCIDDKSRRT